MRALDYGLSNSPHAQPITTPPRFRGTPAFFFNNMFAARGSARALPGQVHTTPPELRSIRDEGLPLQHQGRDVLLVAQEGRQPGHLEDLPKRADAGKEWKGIGHGARHIFCSFVCTRTWRVFLLCVLILFCRFSFRQLKCAAIGACTRAREVVSAAHTRLHVYRFFR